MNSVILIIEDDKSVRENTTELLELAGYNVYSVSNGRDGIANAKKYRPDLIICDIMMVDLDGYGVLRAIQNIPELMGVQFVFLSAKAEMVDLRLGMDSGADDYLTKPFSGDDLLKVVNTRIKKANILKNPYENSLEGLNSFFNNLKGHKDIVSLSNKRALKRVKKGEAVFSEGDTPNFLYFIVSGKVKLFKMNDSGKEYIVDIVKDGDFFGYSSILEGNLYKKCAMALEKVELALIPKGDFIQLLFSNTNISLKFINFMSNNLSEAEDKLINLAYDSARKRVANALIYVHNKYISYGVSDTCFTLLRENISAIAGISPESVSRNLTNFREEGLIETNNGSIKILNIKKLQMIRN